MKFCFTRLLRLFRVTGLTGIITGYLALFQWPLYAQHARLDENINTLVNFSQLPIAKEKIVVAVSKFRNISDQSTQIKNDSLLSNTPNYTNIVLKILDKSGWFIPIQFDNVSDFLNKPESGQLSPVLHVDGAVVPPAQAATIFLESGIISYDASTLTDEHGRRFFRETNSPSYRQDRVTIYIRALSTKSGKILKTIYSSKLVLSQPVNATLYRYVSFKFPLSPETGLTSTAPDQLVVTEAIGKAIEGLIIEGIRDGLWVVKDPSAIAIRKLIDTYEQEQIHPGASTIADGRSRKKLVNIRPQIDAPFISVHPYAGIMRYSGDYTQRETKGTYGLSMEMYLVPIIGIQINAATGTIASKDAFSVKLTSLEINGVLRPMPYQHWTPILYGGVGMVRRSESNPLHLYGNSYGQAQGGIGVQFSPNKSIGFRTNLSYTQPFTDSLDGVIQGNHRDYYMRITLGLVLHLGRFQLKNKTI